MSTQQLTALLATVYHPRGEIPVDRARGDCCAEWEGRYDAAFDAVDPR